MEASVAQWIEQSRPKGKMPVRFLLEAQSFETHSQLCYSIPVDADDKKLLWDIKTKLDEHTTMLAQLRKFQRMSVYMRISYWILLVALALGAFVYLKDVVIKLLPFFPEFNTVLKVLSQIQ